MTWRAATWTLVAVAVAAGIVYVRQGDVFCGDLPGGCPDDTWSLMARSARAAAIVAIVAATAAAVTLLHPEHRGRRLGLSLLTVGVAATGIVNVLADHGDLPGPPLGDCDDTDDGHDHQSGSSKCAGWDPHWTDLFAVPGLVLFAGAGVLVGKLLRWAVAPRRRPA